MAIGTAEIDREKAALPTGWGRFGKALEVVPQIAEPDEVLVATCVTLNPDYQHRAGLLPGSVLNLASLAQEARSATNVVVALTDRRIVLVFTGVGGAPRSHLVMPFDGTTIAERDKKEFTLDHHGERIRFRGGSKKPLARFLDALGAALGRG